MNDEEKKIALDMIQANMPLVHGATKPESLIRMMNLLALLVLELYGR